MEKYHKVVMLTHCGFTKVKLNRVSVDLNAKSANASPSDFFLYLAVL